MKRKGIFIVLVCGIILLAFIMMNIDRDKVYNEGIYIGKGNGHEGPIIVEIEVDSYEIKNIIIKEEYEMPEISDHVYQEVIDKIKKSNNINVDDIAGATYTSNGLIEAIRDAIMKAKIKK